MPHPTVLLQATSNGFVWVATRVRYHAHGPVSRQKEPCGESQGPRILNTLPPSCSVVVQNARPRSRDIGANSLEAQWSAYGL